MSIFLWPSPILKQHVEAYACIYIYYSFSIFKFNIKVNAFYDLFVYTRSFCWPRGWKTLAPSFPGFRQLIPTPAVTHTEYLDMPCVQDEQRCSPPPPARIAAWFEILFELSLRGEDKIYDQPISNSLVVLGFLSCCNLVEFETTKIRLAHHRVLTQRTPHQRLTQVHKAGCKNVWTPN